MTVWQSPIHALPADLFGYWVIYWQEFIILPLYVHNYVDAKVDTEVDVILLRARRTVIALQTGSTKKL